MRRLALDWALSRRQREDLGASPYTWEQYPREGRTYVVYSIAEKVRRSHVLWKGIKIFEMNV